MTRRLDKYQAEALLQAMFGLLKAQVLYPAGHTAVKRACGSVERALEEIFVQPDPLLLARADGYLVVGDVPFLTEAPHSADLSRRLEARGLEGVLLAPGVHSHEVGRFLDWLQSGNGSDWKGHHISTMLLDREGALWRRAFRLYGNAREALEDACGEVEAGGIPDPTRAQECVGELSALLAENPSIGPALTLIKDYDRYTFHHSVNVCVISIGVTRHLGFTEEEVEFAGVAGLFHDIGKTRMPLGLIRKPGRLSSNEWQIIQAHPVHGRDILNRMPTLPPPVASVVYEHHMRFDGGGYPGRPEAAQLHPLSPAVTVADVYDAMTSHRTYNAPVPPPKALEIMAGLRENHLDPRAFDAFAAMTGPFPVGSLVRMTTGEVAVVSKSGEGGDLRGVIAVTAGDGTEIPRNEQIFREARSSDVAGLVGPLTRRIDPLEVLKPRE